VSRHKGLCEAVDDRDKDAVQALEAARSAVRLYDRGEVIYALGDPADYVFKVITGWVSLHRDMPDGRRQIARFVLPGGLFGIEAAGHPLGHTATAVTKISVCPIARPKFDDLRHRVPSLNERFIEYLEEENHHGFESLTVLGQGSAKERVATLIGELAAATTDVRSMDPGFVVKIPLTQRQIAEATGLTSIHVNRVLRQLREDGVIELRDGTLAVNNPRKLERLTQADLSPPARPTPAEHWEPARRKPAAPTHGRNLAQAS
jgi:CRP-like cAMP-binding protein